MKCQHSTAVCVVSVYRPFSKLRNRVREVHTKKSVGKKCIVSIGISTSFDRKREFQSAAAP